MWKPVKKKLRDYEEKSQKDIDDLYLQLLNYEVYSRCENLRFYGIPETDGEIACESIRFLANL